MSTYLIDDEGDLSPSPFGKWRRDRDWTGDVGTFVDLSLSELGFVELRLRPRGVVVRLRATVVSPRALIATIQVLSDLPPTRTMVCASADGAHHKMFRGPRDAVTMLVGLLERRESAEQTFLRRTRRTDDMPQKDVLADLMRFWSAGGDIVERGRLHGAARRLLGGRFALLQLQRDGEALLIKDWGRAYGSFDERWVQMSKGLRFEDQPDYRYASAAVGGYHEAARLGRPALDDVDALISRRGGCARIRYRRLIVPTVSRTGATYLLSTSLEDSGIDLR